MKIISLNVVYVTYPIFENEFDLNSSVWTNQDSSSSDIIVQLIQYGYLEFYNGNLILTNSFNPYETLYLSQDFDEYDKKIIKNILSNHYYQQNFTIDLQDFLSLN